MKSGRCRRRRCSSGRTSSIVMFEMSHFESTISVAECDLRATSTAVMSPSTMPMARVDQDERDVGALRRFERAQLGVVVDSLPLPALAAQAGGVDEHEGAVAFVRGRCRSCRASFRERRRRSCAPRRRACCRATTCRRSGDRGSRRESRPAAPHALSSGEPCDDLVEQVARVRAVQAGDRKRIAEAEAVELVRERVLRRVVDLVRDDEHVLLRLAQDLRELLVARRDPLARVDDEEHEVGLRDRRARLLGDLARDRMRVGDVDTAGVDRQELLAEPLDDQLLAVARRAARVVHDRRARRRQPVDQRRLADVREADDRDRA